MQPPPLRPDGSPATDSVSLPQAPTSSRSGAPAHRTGSCHSTPDRETKPSSHSPATSPNRSEPGRQADTSSRPNRSVAARKLTVAASHRASDRARFPATSTHAAERSPYGCAEACSVGHPHLPPTAISEGQWPYTGDRSTCGPVSQTVLSGTFGTSRASGQLSTARRRLRALPRRCKYELDLRRSAHRSRSATMCWWRSGGRGQWGGRRAALRQLRVVVMPPSTGISAPCRYPAWSDSTQATAAAISSGVPGRPAGGDAGGHLGHDVAVSCVHRGAGGTGG